MNKTRLSILLQMIIVCFLIAIKAGLVWGVIALGFFNITVQLFSHYFDE